MTTPPTPAGWYPDPDGSGGQRYWDGIAWTQHRAPRPQPPKPPPEPRPPEPAPRHEERVGAHRAPESPTEQATAVIRTGPAHASPEPSEEVAAAESSEPVAAPQPPAARAAPVPPEPITARVAPFEQPPFEQPPFEQPPFEQPPAAGDNGRLILWYTGACAALLLVLVLAVVYGAFIHKEGSLQVAAPKTSAAPTEPATEDGGGGAPTDTPTETDAAEVEEAADGPLSFGVRGVETDTTVTSPENEYLTKDALGEFVVVYLSVENTGELPTTFLGTLQQLQAGGDMYHIDDEATFYVGGTLTELNPGDRADVAVAFDVPPGTVPESIVLHTDPLSAGVELPL